MLKSYLTLTVGSDPKQTIFVRENILRERLGLWESSLKVFHP